MTTMTTMLTMNGHRPDYQAMLRDLRTEAERVSAAIRAVEALANDEREVHVNGRHYWANRRAKGPGAAVSSIAKERAAARRGTG